MQLRKLDTIIRSKALELLIAGLAGDIFGSMSLEELKRVVLIGIHRRGVPLMQRIVDNIHAKFHLLLLTGDAETRFYNDELDKVGKVPLCSRINLPDEMPKHPIFIIVDDVFFTGRTVAHTMMRLAAMYPEASIRLAVLVTRSNFNELPIVPEFSAQQEDTDSNQVIHVHFRETDPGCDEGVDLMEMVEEAAEAATA